MSAPAGGGSPARPRLIRAMNEQLLLDHIRVAGQISRADLARISSLSKNTVSLALANLERAGLVRTSGVRTGAPGPAALLYQVHPEAGFVLALDVGKQFLRGAIADFSGRVRARSSLRTRAGSAHARVTELVRLAECLHAEAGIRAADITQTVLGSPGIYDPRRDALTLVSGLAGWEKPQILAELRTAFGDSLMIENDVNAAALAERAHGHGRDVDSFAFVWIGTGIGMGLVLGGRLHRGVHGAAGEIGYLPLDGASTATRGARDGRSLRQLRNAQRRSGFESAASAAGIVRAARDAGMRGSVSARRVFAAAGRGDVRAAGVVADEAVLVARAVCSVIAVVDPDLIVLGGGVGQAAGLIGPVERELRRLAPVLPDLRVSALGADAVVDGCLAAGLERIWETITALPAADD